MGKCDMPDVDPTKKKKLHGEYAELSSSFFKIKTPSKKYS